MEKIKRADIPDNLKSKSELREMRLAPIAKAVAYTYGQYGNLYYLYDIRVTRPIRKTTEKQLKVLEEGRIKLLTCSRCGEVQDSRFDLNKKKVCKDCVEEIRDQELEKIHAERHAEYIKDVQGWCREFLYVPDEHIILDTETTGLGYYDDIVEISLVNTAGKIIFNSLVKPTQEISEKVIAIHGITNEMTAEAPTWSEVWEEIKDVILNKKLLIFNADFDTGMIYNNCERHGIKLEPYSIKSTCIMNLYSNYVDSEGWIGLAKACKAESIEIIQDHRATGDCLMVLELIKKIASKENS